MNLFKAMTGFVFLFTTLTIISFIIEGSPGLAATTLTTRLDSDDLTLIVSDTSEFLDSDILFLGNEIVCYTSKTSTSFIVFSPPFDGRSCRGSKASGHSTGTIVYNATTGVINKQVGFNVAETLSSAGGVSAIVTVPAAFLKALPPLLLWDYSFFEDELFGFPLIYIRYILFAFSAGFVAAIIILMVNIFMGIARTVASAI